MFVLKIVCNHCLNIFSFSPKQMALELMVDNPNHSLSSGSLKNKVLIFRASLGVRALGMEAHKME